VSPFGSSATTEPVPRLRWLTDWLPGGPQVWILAPVAAARVPVDAHALLVLGPLPGPLDGGLESLQLRPVSDRAVGDAYRVAGSRLGMVPAERSSSYSSKT
jgi:hypothetical protein